MAITDEQRAVGLQVGDKLWGKHKGNVYRAEIIEDTEAKNGTAIKVEGIDKKFTSVSAAGGAVFGEGRTCNGWAFWTVGEPPVDNGEKPAPDTGAKKSRKKAKETQQDANPPTGDIPEAEEPTDEVEEIEEEVEEYECGVCHEVFTDQDEANQHVATAHGK